MSGPPRLLDPDPESSDACQLELAKLTQQCEFLENHLSSSPNDYDATFEMLKTCTARLTYLEKLYFQLLDQDMAAKIQAEEYAPKHSPSVGLASAALPKLPIPESNPMRFEITKAEPTVQFSIVPPSVCVWCNSMERVTCLHKDY